MMDQIMGEWELVSDVKGLGSGLEKMRVVSRVKRGRDRTDDMGMNLRSGRMKMLSWKSEEWVVGVE